MENPTEITAAQTSTTMSEADQLNMLKEKARTLGITFSNNIGIDALRAKINGKLEKAEQTEQADPVLAVGGSKTRAQIEQEIRTKQIKEQTALVRCRIYNMNPGKRELHGEIVTVANRFVGTVRRFIPFGEATDNGFHIERILYNELKSRKFQHISTKKGPKGEIIVQTRDVPEYQIELLPMLTEAELSELAGSQQAADRVTGHIN